MDNDMKPYIVYIRLDDANRIIDVNSSAFLTDMDGWIEIDSGVERRYRRAQCEYFDQPIRDERGICRYVMVEGKPVERTQDEMDADYASRPPAPLSDAERITVLEKENKNLKEALDLLLSGATEEEGEADG